MNILTHTASGNPRPRRFSNVVWFLIGAVAAPAAAGAAYATTSSSSSGNAITACADAAGHLRLRTGKACKSNETQVSWNVQGPTGLPGPKGDQGEPGPAGPAGDAFATLAGGVRAPYASTGYNPSTEEGDIRLFDVPLTIPRAGTYEVHALGGNCGPMDWGAARLLPGNSGLISVPAGGATIKQECWSTSVGDLFVITATPLSLSVQ